MGRHSGSHHSGLSRLTIALWGTLDQHLTRLTIAQCGDILNQHYTGLSWLIIALSGDPLDQHRTRLSNLTLALLGD